MHIDLIEDDPYMGEALTERLQIEGFDCRWWRNGEEALAAARANERIPDVVVSDIRLPDLEGPDLKDRLPASWCGAPWIFITGYGTAAQRHELLARGALDFFTKPLDMDRLMQRLHGLQPSAVSAATHSGAPVLGVSGEMRRLHSVIQRLGDRWDTVLITGDSGAGKEELARCLHRETLGEGAPFVAVNATSLPESLIEAELFGYEKGAFTGASRLHKGMFEQADGGTLFLDEIGDMPVALQAKLLRVLQDRVITRLGSEKPMKVQVRLIFATHKRLNEEVRAGGFREDLYYRINVVHLRVPPLRERPEDIPWLAHRFVEHWNATHPKARRQLTPAVEQWLTQQRWEGNVRELRNCMERACLLAPASVLDIADLGQPMDAPIALGPRSPETPSDVPVQPLEQFLRSQERSFIEQALARNDWQIGITADALGISRKNLWERMKRLQIQ